MSTAETIWCPNCPNGDSLLLAADSCPKCGWRREPPPLPAGEEIWRRQAPARAATELALAGGLLLFGTEEGAVRAWDAASGEERWVYRLPEGWAPSARIEAGEGLVFLTADDNRPVASADKALVALELETGEERWRYPTAALRLSPPLLHRGRVYFTASDRRCHAVDAPTGRPVWEAEIPGWSRWAPALGGDLLYVGAEAPLLGSAELAALRLEDGSIAWRWPATNTLLTPAVAEGELYVTCWDGSLTALDPVNGEQRWQIALPRPILTPPVVAGRLVLFGSRDRKLHAVDRLERRAAWSFPTGSRVAVPPLVVEGTVYLGAGDGNLYALDPETGEPAWPEPRALGEKVRQGMASEGGRLWLAVGEGQIVALSLHRPEPELEPEVHERRGDLARAAAGHALRGDLERAGRLYGQMGEYLRAARLFLEAGRQEPAAIAYEAEARRLERTAAPDRVRLAELYERAAALYDDEFCDDDCLRCRRKAMEQRRLPILSLEAEGQFVLKEFNILRVTLRNEGYGLARDVRVAIRGEFDGDLKRTHRGLAPGTHTTLKFRLAPQRAGEATPLDIEVRYRDRFGNDLPGTTVESSVPVLAEWRLRQQAPQFVIQSVEQLLAPGAVSNRVQGSVLVRSSVGSGAGAPPAGGEGPAAPLDLQDSLQILRHAPAPAGPSQQEGNRCGRCGGPMDDQMHCPGCEPRLCSRCHGRLDDRPGVRFCPGCQQPVL